MEKNDFALKHISTFPNELEKLAIKNFQKLRSYSVRCFYTFIYDTVLYALSTDALLKLCTSVKTTEKRT